MYVKYFGFREPPFSVTPDPRIFYLNPLYQEALGTLRYGVENKKGFIVVTGEVGTGKTTLLRRLRHDLNDTVDSVFIFNSDVEFTELLPLALHDLGLEPKHDRAAMMQQLNDYLIKQAAKGRVVALLIDEAHNLSEETFEDLRLLSNLETDKAKLIQIVLAGQPELERRLDQPSLRRLKQRIALKCRIGPLGDDEIGPYIDFRLQEAGFHGQSIFDAKAVGRIASCTGGIPRLINIVCDNVLLTAYATFKRRVSQEMIAAAARRLRLEPEIRPVRIETAAVVEKFRNAGIGAAWPPADQTPRFNPLRPVPIGVWASLLLLLIGGAGTVLYEVKAKNNFPDPGLDVEPAAAAKDEPRHILALNVSSAAVPENIGPPTEAADGGENKETPQEEWLASPISKPLTLAGIHAPDATKIYRVKEGDHLYAIVRKEFGIEDNQELRDAVDQVKELNPQKKNWDVLFAGEEILFPDRITGLPKSR